MSCSKFNVTTITNHEIFKNITVIWNNKKECFFIAKEVAIALGYNFEYLRRAIKKNIPDREEFKFILEDAENFGISNIKNVIPKTYNKDPRLIILTKPGLQNLLLYSKKPLADEFKSWLFLEVVPSIEKKGYYVDYNQDRFNENFDSERDEEFMVLREENKNLKEKNKSLEKENEEVKSTLSWFQEKFMNLGNELSEKLFKTTLEDE